MFTTRLHVAVPVDVVEFAPERVAVEGRVEGVAAGHGGWEELLGERGVGEVFGGGEERGGAAYARVFGAGGGGVGGEFLEEGL